MIDYNLTFDDYRARKTMNGSTLVHGLKSMKQLQFAIENDVSPAPDVTRVGTALHHLIELLPEDRFAEQYVVQPDFHLSPDNKTAKGTPTKSKNTTYCREMYADFADNETREVLTRTEYQRIVRMLKAVAANDEAMSIIMASDREVTVEAELEGVLCRGRIDGMTPGLRQWNMKTTNNIDAGKFEANCYKLNYPFKDALHRMLLAENGIETTGFAYIAVLDSRPVDGVFKEAADCVVIPMPVQVLEEEYDEVRRVLRAYQMCRESGTWPGMVSYQFEVPQWRMKEATLT